jgi:hypothetical protein
MTQVVSMLARPVYHYAEVDRLLRLSPGTAKRWIDGYERAGRVYEPVVRKERTGSPWVMWGEFVETRLLSEFRSSVPMIKLRPVVEWLRERVDRDYPLAYARPFLAPEGKELLVAAQAATGLDEELWMVVPSQQGVLLTPPVDVSPTPRTTRISTAPPSTSSPIPRHPQCGCTRCGGRDSRR